jgi:two-component system NtrC family sensor kinase
MPASDLILLALDNGPELQLLTRALSTVGYATAVAYEENSLERILQEATPALVVMGERLKGQDGFRLGAHLRERFPTLPIVLFSESESASNLKECLRFGLNDCIYPPLRSEDLVKTIERNLQRALQIGDWLRREVKRTTASLEKQVDELQTLVNLGRDVTGSLELDCILTNVVTAAVELTDAEEGSLLLVDESGENLYMRAAHNIKDGFARTFRIRITDSLAGEVLHTGKPLLLGGDEQHKINTAYLVHALIYVPLRLKDKVIGVLGVDNRQQHHVFNERHVLLLSILADYAAIAMSNALLYEISEAERKKFQTTITNIENGVLILDEDKKTLLINPAACDAFGLPTPVQNGIPVLDLIRHVDFHNLVTRGSENQSQYHEISFDDGRVFNAQYTSIPGLGAAITMQDISYLKELDRLKNDFIHTVSHDLRSPLTAVLGYTELLGRVGPLTDQQCEFIQRIQNSVQNITTLVNDLLDLGRIEAGFDTRKETIHINGILQYTLDTFMPLIAEKDLHLNINVAESLPVIRGNPIRLRQMFDNLIGNAVKYTPVGGDIRISIRPEDRQIIIQITDSGPGIPAAEQPHIFNKFFRGSNVADVSGSGLGLAIVKSIVDNHQGRIWVESSEKGSTFVIVMPA